MNQQNQIYRDLLSALQQEGVRYALLRDEVTSDEPIRDLDLLIDAVNAATFHQVAAQHAFFLIKDGYLNPGKKVYLKVLDRRPYLIDVHEMMVVRGVEFLDSAELLARRVAAKGYYRLGDEDFLLSLLLHNVLAKKTIQEKHRQKLQELFATVENYDYIQNHLRNFGLSSVFLDLQKNFRQACMNERLVRKSSRKAFFMLLLSRRQNLLRVTTLWWRKLSSKFWGKPTGVLLAFIGPDGSGKSTTIKAVRSRLQELGIGCSVAYMGPWGGSILHLRKIFFWLNPNPYRSDYKDYYAGKIKEKPPSLTGFKHLRLQMRSALYYGMLVVEMWARWWFRVMPALRQGKIVLGDRYIYDTLTGYKNRPMDYQVAIREKICDRYPAPDIGILLDSQPEIIFARKPQLDHSQLAATRALYRQVAERYNFVVLDTSTDIETTLIDFENNLLPEILRRRSHKTTGSTWQQLTSREKQKRVPPITLAQD